MAVDLGFIMGCWIGDPHEVLVEVIIVLLISLLIFGLPGGDCDKRIDRLLKNMLTWVLTNNSNFHPGVKMNMNELEVYLCRNTALAIMYSR